jgi:DnaJ-class molecular chaperone
VRRFAFGPKNDAPTDYYAVLGLANTASDQEIKRAYRVCASKFHPDVNPSGGDLFAKICAAYEVLKDPPARAKYDRNCRAKVGGSRDSFAVWMEQRRVLKRAPKLYPSSLINEHFTNERKREGRWTARDPNEPAK